jgi:hypothetical protein
LKGELQGASDAGRRNLEPVITLNQIIHIDPVLHLSGNLFTLAQSNTLLMIGVDSYQNLPAVTFNFKINQTGAELRANRFGYGRQL